MSQPFNHINTTCKDGTTIVGAERNQEITEDESPSNGGSDSGPVAGLEIDRRLNRSNRSRKVSISTAFYPHRPHILPHLKNRSHFLKILLEPAFDLFKAGSNSNLECFGTF
jgi:hypothetical protein